MSTRYPPLPAVTEGKASPGRPPPQTSLPTPSPPPGSARRPWSERRLAAAVTATAVVIASAALIFEAVRTRAGRPANGWWTTISDYLTTRPADDTWILAGAATAAALGLLLVVLALTPGLRRLLPLRAPATRGNAALHAELDRKGAALLLRDAAMRVPGVSTARVRVHRRRYTVHADVRFGDTAHVRGALDRALRREVRDRLGLAREPQPVLRVRRGRN